MPLHLTKIAFGAKSYEHLAGWYEGRGAIALTTRNRPTRHEECIGGSLYWIIKHQLVGRARVLGFEDTPEGRVNIVLEAKVIPVKPMPRRAHQGWRYLEDKDVPSDLGSVSEGEDVSDLPPTLLSELADLSLI